MTNAEKLAQIMKDEFGCDETAYIVNFFFATHPCYGFKCRSTSLDCHKCPHQFFWKKEAKDDANQQN